MILSDKLAAPTSEGIPLIRDEYGRPCIEVTISTGRQIRFLIDTGMVAPGVGELSADVFEDLHKSGQLAAVGETALVQTLAGESAGRKGQLTKFKVGPFVHRGIGVREGTLNGFGLDYLSRYRVTIDYARNRLFLAPGNRIAEPTAFDMSGLAVVTRDGSIIIDKVHADTPADAAGIQAGDRLISLNGSQINIAKMLDVRRALAAGAGSILTMQIDRLGTKHEVHLTLANWQHVDIAAQTASTE